MKSVFSRMAAVALTMWLGFAAGTANASGPITFTGWDFSVTGVARTFYDSGTVDTGAYSGWLDFSLPGGSSGSGASTTAAISTLGGGIISTFELWKTDSLFNYISTVASGSTGSYSSLLTFGGQAVPGFYSLRIAGSGANGYSGSITTPVPEPETYAMLLAGLGLIGFTARRRKQNA